MILRFTIKKLQNTKISCFSVWMTFIIKSTYLEMHVIFALKHFTKVKLSRDVAFSHSNLPCTRFQHQLLLLLEIVFPSVDLHLDFSRDAFPSLLRSSISFSFSKLIFLLSLVCKRHNCHRKQPFVGRVASSELSV